MKISYKELKSLLQETIDNGTNFKIKFTNFDGAVYIADTAYNTNCKKFDWDERYYNNFKVIELIRDKEN